MSAEPVPVKMAYPDLFEIFGAFLISLTENMGSDFRKSNDDIKEASLFFDRDLPTASVAGLPAAYTRTP